MIFILGEQTVKLTFILFSHFVVLAHRKGHHNVHNFQIICDLFLLLCESFSSFLDHLTNVFF